MAFWWVNQKQSYTEERDGGYLWAPLLDKAQKKQFHWETMDRVRAGDFILSHVRGEIVALSTAVTSAYSHPRPEGYRDSVSHLWEKDGRRIDAHYVELDPPVKIEPLAAELLAVLENKYSPLDSAGDANQGYLFEIPPRAAHLILDQIGMMTSIEGRDPFFEAIAPTTTEREAIILSRLGQGKFRTGLLGVWGSRCCVSGVCHPALIRASHIKPWKDSNNAERVDRYNGLLLHAGLDAAFDDGLITFADDGGMIVSGSLSPVDAAKIGITPHARIAVGMQPEHYPYLAYHRENVFRGH